MSQHYPLAVRAIWFNEGENKLCWLNTNKLPHFEEIICSDDLHRVAKAIIDMEIRGAPAIGIAAAIAIGIHALKVANKPLEAFTEELHHSIRILANTRPTARWLFYALDRMRNLLEVSTRKTGDTRVVATALLEEALKMYREHLETTLRIGEIGAELIPDGSTVLTHCNTGALASSGYGSALGIIRVAWHRGKKIRVIATETRPLLQGARLTVYELVREGIPVTLITDNTAGIIIRKGLVDLVIVGADRITLDGHVINKVGTYMIALAAKNKGVPFYVAASTRTIDPLKRVEDIIIEERPPEEVKYICGRLITLEDVKVINYAFDVTDPDLVTAIITEKGVVYPPYREGLSKLMGEL